jgi:hypothetical protein
MTQAEAMVSSPVRNSASHVRACWFSMNAVRISSALTISELGVKVPLITVAAMSHFPAFY